MKIKRLRRMAKLILILL